MTFVSHEDYDVDDTFERVVVIRPQSEVDRNLNYAVATVVLAHNLGFEYPLDPYPYRNIHVQAKAENTQQNQSPSALNGNSFITYFAIMSCTTRPLAVAITMIGIRFNLCRLIYFVQIICMLNHIITSMPLFFIRNRTNRLTFLRCSTHSVFLRFHQTIYVKRNNFEIIV